MNKRFLALFTLGLTALLFLTVGILTAADVPVPDEVTIENQYEKDRKPPVKLTHKKHATDYGVSCEDCHHDYQGGKNVWKEGDEVKKCSACHDPENKQGNVDKLNNAYHQNCKDCHKELVKSGKSKDAPYRKCTKCHIKS
jgi:hypothetical protein